MRNVDVPRLTAARKCFVSESKALSKDFRIAEWRIFVDFRDANAWKPSHEGCGRRAERRVSLMR